MPRPNRNHCELKTHVEIGAMKCVAVSSIVVRFSKGPLFQKINRRLRLDVLLTLTVNLPYSLNPKLGGFAPEHSVRARFVCSPAVRFFGIA